PQKTMDDLLARHRKEQRDLQSRITQKKKQATKKTRKGVNDECATLERELKERQALEVAALAGDNGDDGEDDGDNGDDTAAAAADGAPTTAAAAEDEDNTTTPDAPPTPTNPSAPAQRKPNRQRARLARRAAEAEAAAQEAAQEAQSMPDQRKAERSALLAQFAARGLREHVVRADGHCLYSAVADQLGSVELGLAPRVTIANGTASEDEGKGEEDYKTVRRVAAAYISAHSDDFAPFLEEPLDAYVAKVRETGEWGGHMELMALARSYNLPIKVLHADGRVDVIDPVVEGGEGGAVGVEEGKDGDEAKELWLAYYKHGFGLGEHYNSLRKAGKKTTTEEATA
ncbi:uncharacterized protein K452DRAFT_232633, partial [Aplosporella prunicola CBS 121167]